MAPLSVAPINKGSTATRLADRDATLPPSGRTGLYHPYLSIYRYLYLYLDIYIYIYIYNLTTVHCYLNTLNNCSITVYNTYILIGFLV